MRHLSKHRGLKSKKAEKKFSEGGKMEIKVIGAGCKECDTLYQNVAEAVKELGKDAKIEKVEELIEIVKLGVLSAPSLMIDGKLIVSGRVPGVGELKKLLS